MSRLPPIKDRHDRETGLELIRARTRLRAQVTVQSDPITRAPGVEAPVRLDMSLADAASALWPGWTSLDLGLDPATGAGDSGAMLWVYHRPDRGWAAMFLDQAATRWNASPRDAIKFATDHSASGATLTTVCLRLLAMGDAIPDWSTQSVALLTSRASLQQALAEQQVEFLLAMHGLTANLAPAAKGFGYDRPFACTA